MQLLNQGRKPVLIFSIAYGIPMLWFSIYLTYLAGSVAFGLLILPVLLSPVFIFVVVYLYRRGQVKRLFSMEELYHVEQESRQGLRVGKITFTAHYIINPQLLQMSILRYSDVAFAAIEFLQPGLLGAAAQSHHAVSLVLTTWGGKRHTLAFVRRDYPYDLNYLLQMIADRAPRARITYVWEGYF